jgi:hypothetical protein
MNVSVPCGGCGKEIRFGQRTCPSCGAPVSSDLRRALEERLEGSSGDFRSMRNRVREVAILLLVLGLLTLVLGGFVFFMSPETMDPLTIGAERIAFALNCIVGCSMVVASRFVEAHPQKTIVIVLVGWVLVQIVVALLFPLSLFGGLLGKLATVLILGRGFASARAAMAFRRDLASMALQEGGG